MRTFLTRYAKRYVLAIIAIGIVLILLIAYALGFRIAGGHLTRVGTLTLTNVPSGTSIYSEQVLRKTTTASGDVTIELVPGHHLLIVGNPDDYPWSGVVEVPYGKNIRVSPFLLPRLIPVTPLSGTDATQAISAIASTTLPTPAKPLSVQKGCAIAYVSNNQLIEDVATSTPGCTPPAYLCIAGSCAPTIVFAPIAPIQAVLPFPGRPDAVAVSFGGSLYALSLDPTTPQFFAPLVRGTSPKFGVLPDGSLVAKDGLAVSKLSL